MTCEFFQWALFSCNFLYFYSYSYSSLYIINAFYKLSKCIKEGIELYYRMNNIY